MESTGGTLQHQVVRLSNTSAVWIVATLVGLVVAERVFVAAHRPLGWAAAAVIAAVMLDPFVENLARHIRRVPAVLLTFLAAGTVSVGTTYFVFDDIQTALTRLETAAPEAAQSVLERDDRLGEIARDGNLGERVDSFVDALKARTTAGDDVLRTTAGTAPTYFVSAILTVFLLTYGPRIAASALAQDRNAERRRRVEAIVSLALQRARRAVVLTVGVALLPGLIGTAVANWLELPAPSALGFAIALMALLPHIGLVVGSIPLLLVTVGFRSGTMAVVLAVAVLLLQTADSLVTRRWIARRSVHIGLLAPWVVALLAYSVYGIGAAVCATIAVVFVIALLDQIRLAQSVPTAPAAVVVDD